jgi:hypothetical protein
MKPPDPPTCPYCGEEHADMVEVTGYQGYCNSCGRIFAMPRSGGKTKERTTVRNGCVIDFSR